MSLLPSISSNNLTEIDSLRLNGQIGVFSPSSVKKQNYEGSFVVAHDDRAFYCVLRHKDPRQPLVQKVKVWNIRLRCLNVFSIGVRNDSIVEMTLSSCRRLNGFGECYCFVSVSVCLSYQSVCLSHGPSRSKESYSVFLIH